MEKKTGILVVDDDRHIRDGLAQLLESRGFVPIVAPDGTSVKEMDTALLPPVAVIDLNLGDMSGLELMCYLKEQTPHIECIILTGNVTEVAVIDALNLGAYGFIQKPCNTLQLINMIDKAIERSGIRKALEEERALLARRVRERTEELSLANAELIRAARLKDEFLATMSHELRTPLTSILGMSEILQEELYGPLNEKQAKSVQVIERSGQQLLSLINDILDVSKAVAGKLHLEIGPVAVNNICQAVMRYIRKKALEKNIYITMDVNENIGTIQADHYRLKQVLMNLLDNAVKFTPEGGTVRLTANNSPDGKDICFTVLDTGIGIQEENLQSLFQPFSQINTGLARRYSGTGLGLFLVHRLTEMHGGSLKVESTPGKGSSFAVCIPCRSVSQMESGEAEISGIVQPEANKSRITVLLAEDNEANIRMLTGYLKKKGFHIIVARTGEDAVIRVKEENPDIVLMDIHMPGMDGLEATRLIRQHEADSGHTGRVPVIALTALAMSGDREKCIAAGADDYLCKPVSLKELVQKILDMTRNPAKNNSSGNHTA